MTTASSDRPADSAGTGSPDTPSASTPGTSLADGCAVVTGGGGLLGRGLVARFAAAGMDVVVSDLDGDAAEAVARQARDAGVRAVPVVTDVSDRAAVDDLADRAYAEFGRVGVLCNNAGLAVMKPVTELTRADWDKVLGVQFDGVLNGVTAFLPRLLEQGGESHIVNVASMSGVGRADLRETNAPYVTAKFAVVGMTEVMAGPLAEQGIHMSVLCPGLSVADPEQMRAAFADPRVAGTLMGSALFYRDNVLSSDEVAAETVAGIRERRLHIFPARSGRREVVGRHERLMADFDLAERTSPQLAP